MRIICEEHFISLYFRWYAFPQISLQLAYSVRISSKAIATPAQRLNKYQLHEKQARMRRPKDSNSSEKKKTGLDSWKGSCATNFPEESRVECVRTVPLWISWWFCLCRCPTQTPHFSLLLLRCSLCPLKVNTIKFSFDKEQRTSNPSNPQVTHYSRMISEILHLDLWSSKQREFKRRKTWYSTRQCRHVGREFVSYPETNWQDNFSYPRLG